MRLTTPRLTDWMLASLVLVSMLFYLWPVTAWVGVVAPLFSLAVLYVRQLPIPATLALAALQLTLIPLGVGSENPAPLAAMLIAIYTLGRHSRLVWGIVTTLVYLMSFLVLDFAVGTAGFVTFILGGVFTFGVLVQRRTNRAQQAHRTANALADTNLAGHTARIVADERARLGGQALHVVRGSVDAMRTDATAAVRDLDPELIARIADRGRTAITELRWMLGLLRTRVEPDAPAPARRRVNWTTDTGVAVVLMMLTILDGQLPEQPEVSAIGWALLLALPATVIARRSFPARSCLAAAGIVVLAAVSGTPLFLGFGFGSAAAVSLLAWSAAVSGRRLDWMALSALVVAAILPEVFTEPDNVPMLLAIFVIPAFAGHQWSARDRDRRRAEQHSTALRSEIDRRVEHAVRAERLRLARELHDVTSHAVGVMVLQAAAASSLMHTDADAARRALNTVEAVGSKALTELALLFDLLDAGAIGGPGLAGAEVESLGSLVERMRSAGMSVEFALSRGKEDPAAPDCDDSGNGAAGEQAAIVYRVVQEALTNVTKHSPTASVRILVTETADETHVLVRDDGAGFEPASGSVGFGLAGLTERVHGSRGQFTAGPLPGGGFEVSARIPVRAPSDHSGPEPEARPAALAPKPGFGTVEHELRRTE